MMRRRPWYSRASVNVGLSTGSSTPSPRASPRAKTVLPAPRSPARSTTSPPSMYSLTARASASVALLLSVVTVTAPISPRSPGPGARERALHDDEVAAHLSERGSTAAEDRSRMERGNEHRAVAVRELTTAELGDSLFRVEQQLRGEVPERDHHARLQEAELPLEVRTAGFDLVGLRVAVARRPALDDVGDVHIVARQPNALDEAREELPGPADERDALLVLFGTGTLADEHEVGVGIAHAEHHLGPRLRERAARAGEGFLTQRVEAGPRRPGGIGEGHAPSVCPHRRPHGLGHHLRHRHPQP